MQKTFELDDILMDLMNNAYPKVADIINKAIPQQSIEIVSPILGMFNVLTEEVAKNLISAYKEHLLNAYPELKKYKL